MLLNNAHIARMKNIMMHKKYRYVGIGIVIAVFVTVTTFQTLRPAFLPKAALAQAIITNSSQVINTPSTASLQFTNGGSCWQNRGGLWRSVACQNNTVIPYSYVYGLGFSIPSDAKITGVMFSFNSVQQGSCDSGDATPGTYIVNVGVSYLGNVIGTADNVNQLVSTGGVNVACNSNTLYTFGGPGDTWGAALTPAIVNAPSFGYAFQYQLGGGRAFVEYSPNANFTVYYTTSLDAQETAMNIPQSFNGGEKKTTGTDGNSLAIIMQNTGSIPWQSQFTNTDTGTPQGTCGYDYGRIGVGDAPPSGSVSGDQCSVQTTLTSSNYFLAHTPSSFSISPEKIPITYSGVTKTTTYTAASEVTIEVPCDSEDTTCPETYSIPDSWSVSYSGGGYAPSIASGQSVTFPITSITAPSTEGVFNETWQMEGDTGSFGNVVTLPITVQGVTPPPVTPTGTVNVISEDSLTGSAVTSSWDVLSGAVDLCGSSSCAAASESFDDAPLDVPVTIVAVPGSAGAFAFGGIKEHLPIATNERKDFSTLFALSKDLVIGVAHAQQYCGDENSTSQCSLPNPSNLGVNTLTPTASLPVDNFDILWNPEASMSVTPVSISLSSSSPSQQVTIANTSTAPGSELGWSATATCVHVAGNCPNGGNWLTITPSANADPSGITSNSPETATIAYTGGLAPGTYQANVEFSGSSINISRTIIEKQSIPITLIVPAASPTITSVSVSCNQTSIDLGTGTSTCAATVSGTGNYGSGVLWSTNNGTIDQNGNYTANGTPGTAIIVASSKDDPTKSGATTISITPVKCSGPECPQPFLTATPSSIVFPNSSKLSYSSQNVSSCTLSGGQFGAATVISSDSSSSVNGSQTISPASTTVYLMTCLGINGDQYTSNGASVQVTVNGTTRCEQGPNSVGCQGQ
jgi:hypothetical protein